MLSSLVHQASSKQESVTQRLETRHANLAKLATIAREQIKVQRIASKAIIVLQILPELLNTLAQLALIKISRTKLAIAVAQYVLLKTIALKEHPEQLSVHQAHFAIKKA